MSWRVIGKIPKLIPAVNESVILALFCLVARIADNDSQFLGGEICNWRCAPFLIDLSQ